LPTLGGEVYNFTAAVQKRPVVVSVMAGFCGDCKMLAPMLDKLAGEYKGKNVDFVFAFVDEKPESLREIIKTLNVQNAKIAYNAGELATAMGVKGFPATYLIRNGEVEEWSGYSPKHIEDIRARLNSMLK